MVRAFILLSAVSAVFVWLFLVPTANTEGLTHRLFSAFWNLGHFGLFFIWAWLLASAMGRFTRLRGMTLLGIGLLASIAAGYAIEQAQSDGDHRTCQ